MPNMLIIGPQGAGKGTQGTLLATRLGFPISRLATSSGQTCRPKPNWAWNASATWMPVSWSPTR